MIKIKMDAENVYKNLKEAVEFSKDSRALLLQIRGDWGSRAPTTMIGGVHRSFVTQSQPNGTAWKDLSPKYAKRKAEGKKSGFTAKKGKQTILIDTGNLFNSLVFGTRHTVNLLTKTSITYGVNDTLPYAKYHMTGTSKMPDRKFIGFVESQRERWFVLIRKFTNDVLSGKANRKGQ